MLSAISCYQKKSYWSSPKVEVAIDREQRLVSTRTTKSLVDSATLRGSWMEGKLYKSVHPIPISISVGLKELNCPLEVSHKLKVSKVVQKYQKPLSGVATGDKLS